MNSKRPHLEVIDPEPNPIDTLTGTVGRGLALLAAILLADEDDSFSAIIKRSDKITNYLIEGVFEDE